MFLMGSSPEETKCLLLSPPIQAEMTWDFQQRIQLEYLLKPMKMWKLTVSCSLSNLIFMEFTVLVVFRNYSRGVKK